MRATARDVLCLLALQLPFLLGRDDVGGSALFASASDEPDTPSMDTFEERKRKLRKCIRCALAGNEREEEPNAFPGDYINVENLDSKRFGPGAVTGYSQEIIDALDECYTVFLLREVTELHGNPGQNEVSASFLEQMCCESIAGFGEIPTESPSEPPSEPPSQPPLEPSSEPPSHSPTFAPTKKKKRTKVVKRRRPTPAPTPNPTKRRKKGRVVPPRIIKQRQEEEEEEEEVQLRRLSEEKNEWDVEDALIKTLCMPTNTEPDGECTRQPPINAPPTERPTNRGLVAPPTPPPTIRPTNDAAAAPPTPPPTIRKIIIT